MVRVRWNEVLGDAFIHIATIRNLDDVHNEFVILDFIENPERSLANPITLVLSRQFFATMRSRILCEPLDSFNDALTGFLLTDRFDLFGRRAFDDQSIACHCASFS